MPLTLEQLAQRLGGTVIGNGEVEVHGCAPIDVAGPHDITFVANPRYRRYLSTTQAAGVLINRASACPEHVTCILCDDPYFTFRNALIELYGFRRHPDPLPPAASASAEQRSLISAHAMVHPDATVGEGTSIHPFAVVERGAVIGERCVLYPGAYVGVEARLGDDCVLYPNVAVYERCIIGNRCNIHSSTVIGQDGFGYATNDGRHHKIPQTGIVVIEDDVEIGAGCAIERAAMGETRIGRGTKFADLISIGHGTTIGEGCLFVSLVGVSGSVEIGNYVAMGGQVGVAGHLTVGDGVQAAGKTAIVADIPPGKKVGGIPAVDLDRAKRNALAGQDLHGLARRVRQLERELQELRNKLET